MLIFTKLQFCVVNTMNEEKLLQELNTLPQGYISRKKIKGNEYSYLQWLDNGKLKSCYVREDELDYYSAGIARRKELESELKSLQDKGKNAANVSVRAREMTGSLMSANNEIARFENGEMTFCNKHRAPLMLLRTGSISAFLASRAIDSSRTNSRLLKKVMDIHGEPDEIVSLYAHGSTVTDNYWFKAKGSKLKYDDIKFDSDAYSEIALNGKVLIYNKRSRLSPQLTLGGSYEKCWKLIDGEWWMYKRGTAAEIYSELISSRIASLIGIPTAYYECADGYIRTRNFADDFNYEPMSSIAGEDDRIDTVFNALIFISPAIAKEYLMLLFFDAVVKNEDRHNENCGLMRDRTSGEIISLAPNFDNNLSLIARTGTLNMDPRKDGLIKYLLKFVRSNVNAAEMYHNIEMPNLTVEDFFDCISEVDNMSLDNHIDLSPSVSCKQLAQFLKKRYDYLVSKLILND